MHMPSRRRFANADRWGPVSQLLHWTIVAMILVMAYLGLTMTDLPNGPHKIHTYALHKSIGLTILALVSLRVLWRLYAGAPRPVPGTPSWQERIASATHAALYALLFAIPLSGWFLNSTAGFPLQWFGLFNLPKLTHRRGRSYDAVLGPGRPGRDARRRRALPPPRPTRRHARAHAAARMAAHSPWRCLKCRSRRRSCFLPPRSCWFPAPFSPPTTCRPPARR
jgi:cytochrome b561